MKKENPKNHKLIIYSMTYPGLDLIGKSIMDVITDGKAQFECEEALAKEYPSRSSSYNHGFVG